MAKKRMYRCHDWIQCPVSGWVIREACSENVVGVKVQQCQKDREEQAVFSLGLKFKSFGGTAQTQSIDWRMWNWQSGIGRHVAMTLAHVFSFTCNQTLQPYWMPWNFLKKLNFLCLASGTCHILLPLPGGTQSLHPTLHTPQTNFSWKAFPGPRLTPKIGLGGLSQVPPRPPYKSHQSTGIVYLIEFQPYF